ncbi:MAG: hypothetical protein ACRC5H_03640 [Treponemataceae bacterium]
MTGFIAFQHSALVIADFMCCNLPYMARITTTMQSDFDELLEVLANLKGSF